MLISRKDGYTLVEIMIVVGIVAVIMAIAIPNYLKTGRVSAKAICISNLKQIDGAIEQWALDQSVQAGALPTDAQESEIYAYIKDGRPRCPSNGAYTIYQVGVKPQVRCSREGEGHKLPE